MKKLKILYVCPSESWNVRERTVLKDILLNKEKGNSVFLFALKDSFIDLKASLLGIPVFHYFGKLSTKLRKWNRLKSIIFEIEKNDIDVVHCYDDSIVWPVAFFLRKKPLVSLILSVFNDVEKTYKGLMFRTLSRRIDMILNYNNVHQNNIIDRLGVPGIKVQHSPLPISREINQKLTKSRFLKKMGIESDTDIILMGCYVDVDVKDIKDLLPILNALGILSKNQSYEFRFILIGEKNWGNNLIYPDLIQEMKSLGIEDEIVFYRATCNIFPEGFESEDVVNTVEEVMPVLDMWLEPSVQDNLSDLTMAALLAGVPILGARVASLKEFLFNFPDTGTSYRQGDSREVRTKMLEIIENIKEYKKRVRKIQDELEILSDFEEYGRQLGDTYNAALRKRKRFFERKKKKRRS